MNPSRLRPLVGLALLALGSPTFAQQVWHVDETGAGGALLDIQDAVDLASDGDLILVEDGSYGPVTIDGKGLRISADSGAQPVLSSTVLVENLAAGQSVELSSLRQVSFTNGTLIRVRDCVGPVLIQDCDVALGTGFPPLSVGLGLENSFAVTVVRTKVDLVVGSSIFVPPYAIGAFDSDVFVYDSELRAGEGQDGSAAVGQTGADGTEAVRVSGGTMLIAGSILAGGDGGDGDLSPFTGDCVDGGDGGPALRLSSGHLDPVVRIVDDLFTTGPPGAGAGTCLPGAPARSPVDVVAGTLETLTGFERRFFATSVVRVGQTVSLTFEGQPFDLVWLMYSVNPGAIAYSPLVTGAIYPGAPFRIRFRGSVGASGVKNAMVPLADFGLDFVPLYAQALFFNPTEEFRVSNPQLLVLLDKKIP